MGTSEICSFEDALESSDLPQSWAHIAEKVIMIPNCVEN
jgi:hypothetical protein